MKTQRSISNCLSHGASPLRKPVGLIAALVCAALCVECAPSGQITTVERLAPADNSSNSAPDTAVVSQPLAFDPLGLETELQPAPVVYRDSISIKTPESEFDPGDALVDSVGVGLTRDSSEAYDTYRIQLFNSLTFSEAEQERKIAQEIFDYQTTLDYEVPYFKVRIGDFTDYKTADRYLRNFVRPAGYPNSWVTRVRVLPARNNTFDMALEMFFDSLKAEIEAVDSLDDSLAVSDSLGNDTTVDKADNTDDR